MKSVLAPRTLARIFRLSLKQEPIQDLSVSDGPNLT